MTGWEQESLELINRGHFAVSDPGPLHAPVQEFTLRRDDKLALVLETHAAFDAQSRAPERPSGTVRISTEKVELTNIAGVKAVLEGVETYELSTLHGGHERSPLKEKAKVHQLSVTVRPPEEGAFIVDWIANLPASPFVWPDNIKTETETKTSRTIGLSDDSITLFSTTHGTGFSRAAVKLTIDGVPLYVCALGRNEAGSAPKPGCIIYGGTPNDSFRKRIRTVLSFALGVYLVELGHTVYDADWATVSYFARSAYSIDRKVFDLPVLPPAPLGPKYRHELERAALTRMVSALIANYDLLDFGNLNWAYWHACAATIHIAPAHFGATIEGLQRAYLGSHPQSIPTKILADDMQWKALRGAIDCLINEAKIAEGSKQHLLANTSGLNQMPQRARMNALLQTLDLELGTKEAEAWKRRNEAAHGLPIREGEELAAIHDTKLLKVLFHRMLLRITNASDSYIDYASLEFPYRNLRESVPTT